MTHDSPHQAPHQAQARARVVAAAESVQAHAEQLQSHLDFFKLDEPEPEPEAAQASQDLEGVEPEKKRGFLARLFGR